MKKIISLVLVAILCLSVLTGCEAIKGLFGNGGTTVDEGLTDAVTLLHGIYKDKSETTSVDFDVVGQVVVNGVKYPVTWTCDNDKIAIRESTKLGFYTVDLPDVNTEEFTYTLTATISDANGNSQQKSYTFKMLVVNNESVVNELIEGVAYKMFLLQGNKGQRFYALNAATTSENKFINTTVDPKAGAEFYVEKVDGGYKWYTLINDVKTYVYATTSQNGDKISKFIGFSTEEGTVFTYNTDMGGVWTTSINGTIYGVGSYNSFTTISLSEGTFYSVDTIGSTQFVLQFITAEEANKLSPDEEVKIDVPAANSTLTIEEAIALGKLFTKDSYTSGKYYVTGEIVKISSDVYGNMDIKDAEGNTFTIYGTYDATGANRFDAMENQPEVGDTVTVYGIIGFYSAPQMKNGWIVAINGENLGGGNTPSVGDNAVLDLMGNANLVSGSGEQNVFAANGITFTNDKASSSSALTVQESYAQRAYAGSTIKIEYTGMTKIVITFDDYSPDGTKNYMSGMDGMVVEGATFSRNNDVLTITFAAPTDVFQSTNLTSQVRIEKIEVFTGAVENPGEGGDNEGGNEGGETPAPEAPKYTAPVAGQAYDLYMELPTGKVYFAGSMSGDYLATTTDATASVKIFFEEVTGGYHIYFMNGDVKNYITAAAYLKSNGYAGCHFSLTTETPSLAWTYDTNYGILEIYDEVEDKSDTFFAGTYGTYSTVSLSGAYYKDQIASGTQFPARIELASGEVTPPAGGDNEGGENGGNTETPDLPAADSTLSIEEALELGGKYASATDYTGKYTTDKYYVTGTIESIANASKGNFYIVDENGNKLYVYGSYSADGSVGYDSLENKPVVGDVVTVYGVIGAYGPTIQLNNGWITAVTAHEHNYADATCTTKKTCTICNGTVGEILGHNAGSDGICTVCGENLNATIVDETFNIAASAGTLASDSLSISWASDHFNFVGKKANSTTAIRTSDSDHFRVYQGSEFSISGKNGEKITKVVITVTESKYASVLVASLATNGVTATADGTVVTLTIDGGSIDAIEFSATAQFRVKSFVISYK